MGAFNLVVHDSMSELNGSRLFKQLKGEGSSHYIVSGRAGEHRKVDRRPANLSFPATR